MIAIRNHHWQCLAALGLAVVLGLTAADTAEAVVVAGSWVTDNDQAPIVQSHVTWANVGVRGAGTGIYLGNRWVLTANHVGGGDITFTSGTTYQMAADTGHQLVNVLQSGSTTRTDLFLYQLTADPGLPWVDLASTFSVNDDVLMVGAGKQRGTQANWNVNRSTVPWTWTAVTSGSSNEVGYNLLSTRSMSWGVNTVAASGTATVNGLAVSAMTTQFDPDRYVYEGQATTGDSGGPVFRSNGSLWELAGIIVANATFSGQPGGTVVYGNQTYIADLSVYRDQIVAITAVPEPGTVGLAVAAAATGILGRGLRRRRAR